MGTLWNVTYTQKDARSEAEILHNDFYNNIFVSTNYLDSIFFPDTAFAHPCNAIEGVNAAIAKYNRNGKFLFALDLYSDSTNIFPIFPEMTTDRENNMYLACSFRHWIGIQDTIIWDGETDPMPFHYWDIVIVKLSSDFEIKYAKLITGNSNDRCDGIYEGKDGYLYMSCTHTPDAYQTDTVNYFGQDSLIISNTVSSVLKIDKSTGDLIWRESFTSGLLMQISNRNFISDDGERFMVYGRTTDTLFVLNDTIIHQNPDGQHSLPFVLTFDSLGYMHTGKIMDWNISFSDFITDEMGQYYFSGFIWDTTMFGGDTIFYHEDTTKIILAKLNQFWEPVWYETSNSYSIFYLDAYQDTLFFAGRFNSTVQLFDTTFSFGGLYRTILGRVSAQGELARVEVPECSRSLVPASFMLDNCKQLLLSGGFDGTLKFKNDTISPYQTGISDGLLVKMQRHQPYQFSFGPDTTVCNSTIITGPEGYAVYYWNNESSDQSWYDVTEPGEYTLSCTDEYGCWQYDTINIGIQPGFTIELGADTAIALHDTLTLLLPDVYDHYLWSTGDTTNSIQIVGGQFGQGEWNIWIEVNHGVCSHTDSLEVTVVSSVFEFDPMGIKAFPNPVSDKLYIESKSVLQSVELINLTGEVLYRFVLPTPGENKHCIDMAFLKKGVYLLKINTGKSSAVGRIIKM